MNLFWASIFLLLPVVGLSYVAWHVWVLLPWGGAGKLLVLLACVVAFLLLFYAVSPGLDGLPMPFARVIYNIGTSSLIVLLYLVLLFLALDLARLCRLYKRLTTATFLAIFWQYH